MPRALLLLVAIIALQGTAATELTGAGATFPQPFYEDAFAAFGLEHGIGVRYRGVGSGAGQQALIRREVDFAASDVPLADEAVRQAGAPVVQVPTCLGPVAIIVNLPGDTGIRLDSHVLASIFLGRVARWNDESIRRLNPDAALPALPITVVHRSEGSGTTSIVTQYLTQTEPEWREIGTGLTVAWPTGRAAEGSPGVASLVRQVPGAIGYVEMVYALGNQMRVATIRNRSGQFVTPTPQSASLAAAQMTPTSSLTLTDTPVAGAYPISSFSYIALYREQAYGGRTREHAERLVSLLWWLVHEGQQHAETLRYPTLPSAAVARAEAELRAVSFQGKSLVPTMKTVALQLTGR
jgi:phosphate transport system substrate-binding protein